MRSKTFMGCCLVICAAQIIAAQSPDKTLNAALKALGGKQAWESVTSTQMTGTITRVSDGVSGRWQMATRRDSFYWLAYDLDGFEITQGYNGKSGWRRDARTGTQTLTGEEALAFVNEVSWRNRLWLNVKKEKSMLAVAGQEQVNGKAANVVVLTTQRNAKLKLFFDVASSLLVKEEFVWSEGARSFDYADFREVNGIKRPHAVRFTERKGEEQEQYDIKLESIRHNVAFETALFDFPKVDDTPLPDLKALVAEVGRNAAAREALLEQYGYKSVETEREFAKDGSLKKNESRTYEHTRVSGYRLRRLIEIDGQPLGTAEQKKEDERIADQINDIEKEVAERVKNPNAPPRNGGGPMGRRGARPLSEQLRASRLLNPRWEHFRGRQVLVFDFEPDPTYKPQGLGEQFSSKQAGVIWIDPEAKQVVRQQRQLLAPVRIAGGLVASLEQGGIFVNEFAFVNDEVWLPTYTEIKMAMRAFLVVGVKVNFTTRYSDYQKFNVSAEKEKLKSPIP